MQNRSAFGLPYAPPAGQMPAFQPAPRGFEEFPVKPVEKDSSAGYYLTILGTFLLILVAMTTVWDSTRLIYNESFVYFLGRSQPFWTIMFCCAVVGLFILLMLLVQGCGRRESKTNQTFMYLFTTIVTLLGLGLLLFAIPLQTDVKSAYNELMVQSDSGPRTAPLAAYYTSLLSMRLKPDCISKVSVEQCSGFKPQHPYTGYLKFMELDYQCSGFGYKPGSVTLPSTTPQPLTAVLLEDSTALLQGSSVEVVKHMPLGQSEKSKLSLISRQNLQQEVNATASKAVPTWVKLPKGIGDTANNMQATGWMTAYPPTLFTNANFKTSCEGAAARDLRFTAGETAHLMYLTGAALLVVSVLVGFLKLCTMCRTDEESMDARVEKIIAASADGQYHTFSQKIVL